MKLHPSTPIVLGFSWLCSTNPHIDWPSLTLCFDQDNPTDSGLVLFDVSPLSKNPKTMINHPQIPLQLCSRYSPPLSTVAPSLQLFDGSPATTGITQYYNNTLTLNNDLQFQAQLLITQLPPSTPIMLRLPWLQDINPDIDWKNLTMQFPGPKASLVAAIPLCLQSISDSDISDSGTSTSGATQSPSTSDSNPDGKEYATPSQSPPTKSQ
ncbi:hypothetical protein E4T56_gene13177 [Termitomyces sp. T112]|nr:hypothetical protein E4T56_gene13177 [Termitomyces sp. T112]